MDILYVYKEGASTCNGCELRYSLRSVERFGLGVDRVFIVGDKPLWASDKLIHIPFKSSPGSDQVSKNADIADRVVFAVNNSDISDELLVSMDDHFYIKTVDFNNYPFYVKKEKQGGFLPANHINGGADYTNFLVNCNKFLVDRGLPNMYFTLHRNMHVSRKSVLACKDLIDEAKSVGALELFVLINNYRLYVGEVVPTVVTDFKLRGGSEWYKLASCDECFSTYDFTPGSGLHRLLERTFNKKSTFEL